MKVAVIFDNFGPYHLARLKAASQVCTLLAIEMNDGSQDYDWEPTASPKGFNSVTLSEPGAPRSLNGLVRAHRLRRALAEFGPDCVFVPGWWCGYSLQALRWCRTNRIPVVIMSESTECDSPRYGWKEWLKSRIVRMSSAAFVGGAPHAEYVAKLGMPTDRIFQGYDVVDNGYFGRAAEVVRERSAEFRKKSGLTTPYFLASARFIEQKNLQRLLKAFARYRDAACRADPSASAGQQNRSWSLVLLGDGAQRRALEQLVSDLELDACVLLPGFKQYAELPVYYGLANAFVHASTSEPWGLVVNEAMASGLPVLVSSRCGCAPDLVRERVNGFRFDPRNVAQLAELMLTTWNLRSQLSIMGTASAKIISNWGPSRFSQGLLSAAEKAGSKRGSRMTMRPNWLQPLSLR